MTKGHQQIAQAFLGTIMIKNKTGTEGSDPLSYHCFPVAVALS